jgi:hypothetical protein
MIRVAGGWMLRKLSTGFAFCIFLSTAIHAITSLDVKFLNQTVVFFFDADSSGSVLPNKQVATGFLLSVPRKNAKPPYLLIITARHVVDPVWAGCAHENPVKLFLRVNKANFDVHSNEPGIGYVPINLIHQGGLAWNKSSDESVDLAVLPFPAELASGAYDIKALNFRNFGKPDEIAKLGIGSQTASTGLVPGLEGENRNNPIFHFGKIASIPDETAKIKCTPYSTPRSLRVWWIATTLLPGASGSPIYFDPLFPPGADITAGEPRAMLIGLQSVSLPNGDLAGMTPASFIIDVISHSVPDDADFSIGVPTNGK